MGKFAYGYFIGIAAWIVLLITPASALPKPLACSLIEGNALTKLSEQVESIRERDNFYKQVVEWKGEPSRCRGRVNKDPLDDEYWLGFSWPDGSKFESRFELPEISVIEYTRAEGLTQPDDVIARTRKSAAEFGMKIDWAAPEAMKEGDNDVIEYRDPDQGLNGIVRLTYDQRRRLIGVWLSMAP